VVLLADEDQRLARPHAAEEEHWLAQTVFATVLTGRDAGLVALVRASVTDTRSRELR
jgi:hypothetical protein